MTGRISGYAMLPFLHLVSALVVDVTCSVKRYACPIVLILSGNDREGYSKHSELLR